MTSQTNSSRRAPQIEPFVISRVFNAPRELLFRVWTDPKHIRNWFTPKGFTMKVCNVDLRPGGINHSCMVGPDMVEMWGKVIYHEIVRPERLIYVQSFSDQNGGITRHPLSTTWPLEMLTTITFKDLNGKTEVTIEWLPVNATDAETKTFDENRKGMTGGWSGTFEQLEDYLAQVKV